MNGHVHSRPVVGDAWRRIHRTGCGGVHAGHRGGRHPAGLAIRADTRKPACDACRVAAAYGKSEKDISVGIRGERCIDEYTAVETGRRTTIGAGAIKHQRLQSTPGNIRVVEVIHLAAGACHVQMIVMCQRGAKTWDPLVGRQNIVAIGRPYQCALAAGSGLNLERTARCRLHWHQNGILRRDHRRTIVNRGGCVDGSIDRRFPGNLAQVGGCGHATLGHGQGQIAVLCVARIAIPGGTRNWRRSHRNDTTSPTTASTTTGGKHAQ